MAAELKKTGDITLKNNRHNKPFVADVRYLDNGSKKPVILFVHGFKGFKDWGHFNLIADFFAREGFVFVKLNLSHNGTTPEHPMDFVDIEAFSNNTFSIELDDIGIVIESIINHQLPVPAGEVDAESIHLIGHSRGGGLVLLKAAEDQRIASVSAWAPIHNLKERWPQEVLEKWKKDGVYHVYNGRTKQNMPLKYSLVKDVMINNQRLNIPEAVGRLNCPILMIHGTEDKTLDHVKTIELAKKNQSVQVEIIEDASHTFGGRHPYNAVELPEHTKQAVHLTLQFLRK
ncbi:MAG: alpha/beta fold hydrolase [Bacteroidota bacterium]